MAGFGELVRGDNLPRCAVVGGGMIIHAVNVFIVATILPSVVREIGGLQYFAWSTTLYVVASLLGAAGCGRLLPRLGARTLYRVSLATFGLGCLACAVAPAMPVLLAGRFVQGLGAGTLSALSFTMVRTLFAQPLWARAMAAISAAWGAATLAGPAIGGMFAQYGAWRAAFWSLLALSPVFLLLVEFALPRNLPRSGDGAAAGPRMAFANLVLLAGSALCISAGSMSPDAAVNGAGLALCVAGFAWFARREAGSGPRLLPRGAVSPATPLGATYLAMALLLIGVNTEIFVPLFLQVLHGMRPITAGYLSALMAFGWTVGSLASSGLREGQARAALTAGPLALAAGLLGLAVVLPQAGTFQPQVTLAGICLSAMGLGIGMCWPHLATRVFVTAPEGEKDLAAASMTVVVMVSNAVGSALGGLVTNLGGLTHPGGVAGAAAAAALLFGLYVAAPLLAALVVRLRVNAAVPLPAAQVRSA